MNAQPPNMPSIALGSLVRTRGLEWIVPPSGDAEILRLRRLSGSECDLAVI